MSEETQCQYDEIGVCDCAYCQEVRNEDIAEQLQERWSLRDEGRSHGYGESYGECNT